MRIKDTEEKVLQVLAEYPESRNDDYILVGLVWALGFGIDLSESVAKVLGNHKELGLPGWDTIRRARQRLQAEHEFLRADENVASKRAEQEERFMAYALGRE